MSNDPLQLWQPISNASNPQTSQRTNQISRFSLDVNRLQTLLGSISQESNPTSLQGAQIITLPTSDGRFQRFQIVESPIMAPELAAKYPEIKTYRGQGVDDPSATVRLDVTPAGLHAQVLSSSGSFYIDPNNNSYISYYKRDLSPSNVPAQRDLSDILTTSSGSPVPAAAPTVSTIPTVFRSSGTQLRTYDLAVAATGEYTQFFGGVSQAIAAIATTVNRVTGIFETEVASRLVLVANNNLLVYSNPATDPYTNTIDSAQLNANQTNIDAVIGNANYDIGHLFSTDPGGGLAGLGVLGETGLKALGGTGLSNPSGDAYDVDFVAHEIGHQFGGNHTFNANDSNRNASTAYEPGSGSTIMAYAGVISGSNLQPNSDPYFSFISFDEIAITTTTGAGNTSATITSTGNSAPTINAGSDFTIPARTPFALTATGSDPNGDTLTYLWEERDLGPAQNLPLSDNGSSPLFRTFSPTLSPTRIFPQLPNILNNNNVGTAAPGGNATGELLPTTTRTLNFRVTARDNRSGGGGVNSDDIVVNVVNTGAPFQVTSQNAGGTWGIGTNQTVTWNVAGTTAAPINAANVNILLSTDSGNTFSTVLAANTPNDGTQNIIVPNLPTANARIKVEAAGNIFFDISNSNFTIAPPPPPANDNFANRITLTGQTANTTGTNLSATGEASEPVHGGGSDTTPNSVWWSWTAPTSGNVTITTIGSDFDTTLGVYTGTAVAGLTPIASNNDFGAGATSSVTFAAVSGTTYQIAIDGNDVATGNISLNLALTPDPSVFLAIAPTTAIQTEGNSGVKAFTFTVNRTGNTSGSTNVNYAITGSGLNPANAADFGTVLPTGTVSFTAGQTSKVVTVNVKADTIVEPDEDFTVTLSNPTNGATVTTASATGTILNDDTSLAIAADPSAIQAEGNSGPTNYTFTVTRNGDTAGSTNVNWAVTGGTTNPTNAADFVGNILPKGTVSFATGETTKTVTVAVNSDLKFETDENFVVTLSAPTGGATLAANKATGTIQNDDPVDLAIAATNAAQTEGNSGTKPFTFAVTRSGDTTGTTSVKWAVTGSGVNPANAADFSGILPSGTLNFAAGQTSQTITVNVKGDISLEANEGFAVTLSSPTAGTAITNATAVGTILNDDTAATFAIAATTANQTEGNSGNKPFTFTVTRTGDTTGTNEVSWGVSGSGLNPADFADFGLALPTGTLSFTAGQVSKVVTVNVKGDAVVEPDEGFTVTLSNPSNGAAIATNTATANIINDDIILGTAGSDTIAGTTGNDTISGLDGLDSLSGVAGNDSLSGGNGDDILVGGTGNDTLIGGNGNDTLTGVDATSGFGLNEIDKMTGGVGSDRFILGDINRTYYVGSNGLDYLLITDFGSGDVIQKYGSDVLTIGGTLPTGVTGRAIYLGSDLVAVVQGTVPTLTSFVNAV